MTTFTHIQWCEPSPALATFYRVCLVASVRNVQELQRHQGSLRLTTPEATAACHDPWGNVAKKSHHVSRRPKIILRWCCAMNSFLIKLGKQEQQTSNSCWPKTSLDILASILRNGAGFTSPCFSKFGSVQVASANPILLSVIKVTSKAIISV